jgi:hypothetical protein
MVDRTTRHISRNVQNAAVPRAESRGQARKQLRHIRRGSRTHLPPRVCIGHRGCRRRLPRRKVPPHRREGRLRRVRARCSGGHGTCRVSHTRQRVVALCRNGGNRGGGSVTCGAERRGAALVRARRGGKGRCCIRRSRCRSLRSRTIHIQSTFAMRNNRQRTNTRFKHSSSTPKPRLHPSQMHPQRPPRRAAPRRHAAHRVRGPLPRRLHRRAALRLRRRAPQPRHVRLRRLQPALRLAAAAHTCETRGSRVTPPCYNVVKRTSARSAPARADAARSSSACRASSAAATRRACGGTAGWLSTPQRTSSQSPGD